MILIDTSAWVECLRATGSTVDRRLSSLIAGDDRSIAVTEPVVMELVAGVHDEGRVRNLRRLLLRFDMLHFDVAADLEGAARIYRRCRRAGITPRGLIDCMLAAVAWRHNATLLAQDADLTHLAQVIQVPLDAASI